MLFSGCRLFSEFFIFLFALSPLYLFGKDGPLLILVKSVVRTPKSVIAKCSDNVIFDDRMT